MWLIGVHTKNSPHQGESWWSWRIIWWVLVFAEVCNKNEQENKQEQPLEVTIQQKTVKPHVSSAQKLQLDKIFFFLS